MTSRLPIQIYDDSHFTSTNGVSSGSGIVGNPYIIENWNINASTSSYAGIEIRNTTAYFIIRNCTIHDGDYRQGIYFYNVTNGKIENTIINNNDYGIRLYSSSNNTITNCYLYDNSYGIYLEVSSNNNTITNCAVYNNSDYGIYLSYSSNNQITNCDVYNNSYYGIRLYSSSDNQITNCYVYNHQYGIYLTLSSNIEIHYCRIYDNINYGVYNGSSETTYQVDATYNWWGSASGPYHPSTNPSGTGNRVGSNVLYYPWLTTPVINQPPTAFIDSISPSPRAGEWQSITFKGSGTDVDGTVVAYNWRCYNHETKTGYQFSTSAECTTAFSSVGTYTIYFKVQDNEGSWSNEVSASLTIYSRTYNASVTTGEADTIRSTSVWVNLSFTNVDVPKTKVFFQYRPEGAGLWFETSKSEVYGASGDFSLQLTDLESAAFYYYRAIMYLCYEDGTYYDSKFGETKSFTTGTSEESITTLDATNITPTSAILNGAYKFGENPSASVGFKYFKMGGDEEYTSPIYTIRDINYSQTIGGLTPNQEYGFRACRFIGAPNDPDYYKEGDLKKFITLDCVPEIISQNAENITRNSATLKGEFNGWGIFSLNVKFKYKPSSSSEWNETDSVYFPNAGYSQIETNISDLSKNTQYDYKLILTYDESVVEGWISTFTTLSDDEPWVRTLKTTNLWHPSGCATLNADFHLANQPNLTVWMEYKKSFVADWTTGSKSIYYIYDEGKIHSEIISGVEISTKYDVRGGVSVGGISGGMRHFYTPSPTGTEVGNISNPRSIKYIWRDFNMSGCDFDLYNGEDNFFVNCFYEHGVGAGMVLSTEFFTIEQSSRLYVQNYKDVHVRVGTPLLDASGVEVHAYNYDVVEGKVECSGSPFLTGSGGRISDND